MYRRYIWPSHRPAPWVLLSGAARNFQSYSCTHLCRTQPMVASILGIGIDDAIAAGSIDWDHRDPFDRIIVAQAARNNLALVTRDAAIRGYASLQTVVA